MSEFTDALAEITCYACGWHGTARIDQHQCSHVIEISKLNRLNTQLQADLKASQADCKRAEEERDELIATTDRLDETAGEQHSVIN